MQIKRANQLEIYHTLVTQILHFKPHDGSNSYKKKEQHLHNLTISTTVLYKEEIAGSILVSYSLFKTQYQTTMEIHLNKSSDTATCKHVLQYDLPIVLHCINAI